MEDINIYSVLPSNFYVFKWHTLSYIRRYFPVETRIVFKNKLPVGLITKEISDHFLGRTVNSVNTETQSFQSQVSALIWVVSQVIREQLDELPALQRSKGW